MANMFTVRVCKAVFISADKRCLGPTVDACPQYRCLLCFSWFWSLVADEVKRKL